VPGVWEGQPTPTFTYKWLRDGSEIAGATASSYKIVEADRGHSLSCIVTASNTEGKGEAHSSNNIHVPGSPPIPLELPTIAGTPEVGTALTCSEGKWSGAPVPTVTYQWLLNGVNLPSATSPKYTVPSADRGLLLTCKVTASNSEGTESASSSVHVPGIPPHDLEKPHVSGTAALGSTLTCQPGIWEGKPPPALTYQWLRDQTPIASATAGTYIIEPADQGHLLSCDVSATNSEGTVEAESEHGMAIPVRTILSKETPSIPPTVGPTAPTAAQILAALGTQLVRVHSSVRIASVLKAGGYSFSLLAPAAGTVELEWYEFIRGAHGKTTKLVVAQSTTSFAKALTKGTVHLRLTARGRRLIAHKKQITLRAKAVFRVLHGVSVTWLDPILLRH
jgi:hypothetical protein